MGFIVYILRSLKDKKLYVGYTSNLRNRLKKHKYGEVKATKFRRPLELIYYEFIGDIATAMKRERFLKSLYGAKLKTKLIKNFKGIKGKI